MTNPRPLPVTIIGWVYIAAGLIGFLYHFREMLPPVERDTAWVELIRLTAILCGVYVLRGSNWARWLAVLWMAYHVVLSLYHTAGQVAMHGIFCIVIAYFLFYAPPAMRFFRVR